MCGPPVQFLFFAYHAALLEERDAITEDVIIVIPEICRIHSVIDLLNGSIASIRQSIQSFGMEVFKDEPEMKNALIAAFPGTEMRFFDAAGNVKPILRLEGQEVDT